jgi:hypothetical protein
MTPGHDNMQAALVDYNLAPLCTRRDMAMLAHLHKVSLGLAPKPIRNMFKLRAGTLDCHGFSLGLTTHCRQLHDPIAFNHPPIIGRSVYGLIRIYNRLPASVLDAKTTQSFQLRVQNLVKDAAKAEAANRQLMFRAC